VPLTVLFRPPTREPDSSTVPLPHRSSGRGPRHRHSRRAAGRNRTHRRQRARRRAQRKLLRGRRDTGQAYQVPLDARSAETIRRGDLVSLTTKPQSPVLPSDRHIHQRATASNGIFTEKLPSPAQPPRIGVGSASSSNSDSPRPTAPTRGSSRPISCNNSKSNRQRRRGSFVTCRGAWTINESPGDHRHHGPVGRATVVLALVDVREARD
jgi:hypothetical protein